jgi:hypothetical protein
MNFLNALRIIWKEGEVHVTSLKMVMQLSYFRLLLLKAALWELQLAAESCPVPHQKISINKEMQESFIWVIIPMYQLIRA